MKREFLRSIHKPESMKGIKNTKTKKLVTKIEVEEKPTSEKNGQAKAEDGTLYRILSNGMWIRSSVKKGESIPGYRKKWGEGKHRS